MNLFTDAAFKFFDQAEGTRRMVQQFCRWYDDPRERAVALSEHLHELLHLDLEGSQAPGLVGLMREWLESARMHVNFLRLAERLLRRFGPRAARAATAPSVN